MSWHHDTEQQVRLDDVTCIKETAAAVCVTIEGEEHWIPKSQIHDDSEVYADGTSGTLIISAWIAEKRKIGCS